MAGDPIVRFGKWLVEQKLATEAELKQSETAAANENKASWEFALKSPLTKPEQGLENVWALGKVEATQFLDRKGTAVAYSVPDYVKKLSKTLVLEA
jgi:TPP-dependent pyruvate/acetoin dehydrogenase alpha subunit